MAGALEHLPIAVEGVTHHRHEDQRQQRELPVDEQGTHDAGPGFHRFSHQLPAEQFQARGHLLHVEGEPRHEVGGPVGGECLIVERQHPAEALLANRHHHQFDDAADQYVLDEDEDAFQNRRHEQQKQDECKCLEPVLGHPGHDVVLHPGHRQVRPPGVCQLLRVIDPLLQLIHQGQVVFGLLGLEFRNADIQIDQVRFLIRNRHLGLAEASVDVLMEILAIEQDLHDGKRDRQVGAPQHSDEQAETRREHQLLTVRPQKRNESRQAIHRGIHAK